MIPLRQLYHLFHINRVLVKHGLDELIFAIHLFRPIRFVEKILPWRWFKEKETRSEGERIRLALEDLGPIFVKFGQMLSTRPDLLPPDIAMELRKLQDKVPPFSSDEAIRVIESAYDEPVASTFAEFDSAPLASASIAQVHVAKLHDGQEVVVKVVRPDIIKTIKRDIALLYVLARLAEKYWADGRRLRPVEVVEEYEKTILDELDMQREAASATQLRRNFKDSELLYIPEVHWPLTRKSVMVMERIYGTPVGDIKTLREKNVDLIKLSEDGVTIFFTQVFKHNFFHADMHPGNIFVSDEEKYIAIDFGIVGTLNPEDQRYLAENFLAFFSRDYRRVAELHVESGWVPYGTRIDEFESAIRSVCEPIFEKPLKDISFGQLLLRLFQTARRFDMEVQPQLVLLQKTLLNIEGLGRELNPDLDLWKTAKPFLEGWMADRIGVRSMFKKLGINAPTWVEKLPEMPNLVYETMSQMKFYHQNQIQRDKQALEMHREMKSIAKKSYAAIFGAVLIIVATLIFGLSQGSTQSIGSVLGQSLGQSLGESLNQSIDINSIPLISWILGTAGIAIVLYSWPSNRKI